MHQLIAPDLGAPSRNATILGAIDRASGRPVAIKVFLKQTTISIKLERMQREVAVLRTTSSIPGIVKLLEVLEDDTSYYTVLEALPGKPLQHHPMGCCLGV